MIHDKRLQRQPPAAEQFFFADESSPSSSLLQIPGTSSKGDPKPVSRLGASRVACGRGGC
jgi:hypothetical protein